MSFNRDNKSWKEGKYPLFLGEAPALYDSINVTHPELFKLYKQQKAQDWSEDEINLDQSKIDMMTCPIEVRDVMIENIALQWTADSVASNSIAPCFAPFVTNSEYWSALLKVSEIECLTPDHEVLTPVGWKPISEITASDKVAQFDPTNRNITFVNPTAVVKKQHTGKMFEFRNYQKHVVQKVTPNHRMLKYDHRNDTWVVDVAENFDFDKGASSGAFNCPVAGISVGTKSELSSLERLYIAIQADGSVSERYTGERCGTIPVWFSFAKERKIQRLFSIVEDLGFDITELTGRNEVGNVKAQRKFKIDIPLEYVCDFKNMDWVNLENVSQEWCVEFVKELREWDGNSNRNNVKYTTINKTVADIVQAVGVLGNFRSHYAVRSDNRSENFSDCYHINFHMRDFVSGQSIKKTEFDYDGLVYCLTVPTSFFMVRCEGAVSVTGNCLHSLTYSEIVRQCFTNPNEIFDKIYSTHAIYDRLDNITTVFKDAKIAGAKYTLGMVDDTEAYNQVMRMTTALYCLERLQFMASFQATFAVVETGFFYGIGKLVQKIMLDERFIHAEVGAYVLRHELSTERGKQWFNNNHSLILNMIKDCVNAEYAWSSYLFSDGRKVVGLTENLMNKGVDYHAQDLYDVFGFELPYERIKKNPLKYMDTWLDLNKFQNAQQEADSANYNLNIIIDDMGEDLIDIGI